MGAEGARLRHRPDRFGYESLVNPPSVWEYRLDTGQRRLLKETPILDLPGRGGYDRSVYVSERLWADAPDGTRVPVSVVRLTTGAPRSTGPRPVCSTATAPTGGDDALLRDERLSLLDRGVVFAIAHVRGGGELGRPWYEGGKGRLSANTFSDFVAARRLLVQEGYVAPDRLLAEGGARRWPADRRGAQPGT